MKAKKIQITILISVLILSALACNLPAAAKKAAVKVVPTIPAAEQQQLQDQLATQVSEAMSGVPVTIELTESQLTSLINLQTPNIKDAQLSNIQVTLDNNQIQIGGDAATNGISGKVNIVLAIASDAEGKPTITVTSATLGGFPLPEGVLSTISTTIDQALQGQTGQGFVIQSMTISDHKLIITAQKM
jgi:uncharacterized protein YpmS